jgi:hypothetical protein
MSTHTSPTESKLCFRYCFLHGVFHNLAETKMEKGLQYQPDVETKNQRPLKRPVVFGAKWELCFGPENRFRAFYRIEHDKAQVVLLSCPCLGRGGGVSLA